MASSNITSKPPIILPSMQAGFATFSGQDNYFVGMRVNLLMADMESTKDTKFANVIESMRIDQSYSLNQATYDDLNETFANSTAFLLPYREQGMDPGGFYGQGYVKYLPGNMSLTNATAQLKMWA